MWTELDWSEPEFARGRMLFAHDGALPLDLLSVLDAIAAQLTLALGRVELARLVHETRDERRFQSIVRHSSDLITLLGPDLRTVYENRQGRRSRPLSAAHPTDSSAPPPAPATPWPGSGEMSSPCWSSRELYPKRPRRSPSASPRASPRRFASTPTTWRCGPVSASPSAGARRRRPQETPAGDARRSPA